MPQRDSDHPEAEQAHGRTLDEGGLCPQVERRADDEEADAVVSGIGQKVQRVGLERYRSRCKTGGDLDHEHDRVDGECRPTDMAKAAMRLPVLRHALMSMATAMGDHETFPLAQAT